MSDYYYIVAGLPDVAFDGSKPAYSVERFREEIYPMLSKKDARVVDLFFLERDNANLLNILRNGENAVIEFSGCFSKEKLAEFAEQAKSGYRLEKGVPSYICKFLEFYFANELNGNYVWADILASYYYEYAMGCSNSFVSEWFEYNLNVNNILVAMAARKYKMSIADAVIGNGEVADALRTSSARDFGLSTTIGYIDAVQRLCENERLQEREHQLDELRWQWLEEKSVFNYFSIERLYVFLQKLAIVERWAALDADKGMARYNEMIAELKGGMSAV